MCGIGRGGGGGDVGEEVLRQKKTNKEKKQANPWKSKNGGKLHTCKNSLSPLPPDEDNSTSAAAAEWGVTGEVKYWILEENKAQLSFYSRGKDMVARELLAIEDIYIYAEY